MHPKYTQLADRLWSRVDRSGGPDACWPWQGGTNKGYGILAYRGKKHRTHRLAWEIVNGPIQDGLCALHECDNPPCCNPAHLFVGTRAVNNADKEAKGRDRKYLGPKPWKAELSADDVRAIRAAVAAGVPQVTVAARYRLSKGAVHAIVHRRNWKHLD